MTTEQPASSCQPCQAVVPPSILTWLLPVYCVITGVLGALAVAYPSTKAISVGLSVVAAVGGGLGLASPGLRKTALLILVGVSVAAAPLTLTSCAAVPVIAAEVSQCGPGAAKLVADVDAALAAADYLAALDVVASQAPAVVKCILAEYASATSPKTAAFTQARSSAKTMRAREWLATRGF